MNDFNGFRRWIEILMFLEEKKLNKLDWESLGEILNIGQYFWLMACVCVAGGGIGFLFGKCDFEWT
jgi:hypothetical protein